MKFRKIRRRRKLRLDDLRRVPREANVAFERDQIALMLYAAAAARSYAGLQPEHRLFWLEAARYSLAEARKAITNLAVRLP